MNKERKIRIGIDARFYGPLGKGLGRYTQEIVDNILKINQADPSSSFYFVIFLSPENFDEFVSDNPRVKKVRLPFRWYSLSEQILFPFYIWKERLNLMHFPHFNVPLLNTTRFIVTIHDLILTRFPTIRASTLSPFKYRLKNLAYRLVILSALRRSRHIITVSCFTKDDIIKKFSVKPDKISVTYEGVANLNSGQDSLFVAKISKSEVLSKYHITERFLLYVGNAYPHKNLEELIRVFAELRKEEGNLRLVLVGKDDYFYQRLKKFASSLNVWQVGNDNSPIIFAGYVPDRQLEVLYQQATAYVFPSLYEGFGLPPLEAMAKGCPVLSANTASLPEILGSAALYFDPYKQGDLLLKLKMIISDEALRSALIERGRKQTRLYNWWECARETFNIYRRYLNK